METYADLHIHTYFSDGTMSPEEIADEAARRGVGLIAVCDHNILDGSRELAGHCAALGIAYISGVEIDSLDGVTDHHILAYGADLYDSEFEAFIKRNRELLDEISLRLVNNMSRDCPDISLEDYRKFTYDRRLGGWKGMHYLIQKGLADSFASVRKYYDEYDCPFSVVDFPPIAQVCAKVRKAGGYAVLAHPGETMKNLAAEDFASELERIVSLGLDGIECYYPTHSSEVTELCLKLCRERGLMITAGSDCHGAFSKTDIGEVGVTTGQLELKGLI